MDPKKIQTLLNNFQDDCIANGFGVRILHEDGEVAHKITAYIFPEDVILEAQKSNVLGHVEDQYTVLLEETSQKRKRKRSVEELPDPTQSPKAWVNRKAYSPPNPTYSTKVSPNISEEVNAFREKNQLTKKDMTEQALLLFMEVYSKK